MGREIRWGGHPGPKLVGTHAQRMGLEPADLSLLELKGPENIGRCEQD